MLTGDENIIDIDFAVFWRIRDAERLLCSPPATAGLRGASTVAESVMREVIGRTPIQPALTRCPRPDRGTSVKTGDPGGARPATAPASRSPRCSCRRSILPPT